MKKKLIVLSGLVFTLMPALALAVSTGTRSDACGTAESAGGSGGTLQSMMCKISELLNAVLPVLIALGVVFFVWGVISYIVGGDEEKKAAGRTKMIYGIIGLAVIIGMWGLVKVVTNTFGVEGVRDVTLPSSPF